MLPDCRNTLYSHEVPGCPPRLRAARPGICETVDARGETMSDIEPDAPDAPDAEPRDAPASSLDPVRDKLLDALPDHVMFDGWSQAAIDAAAREQGIDPAAARQAFPRGGVDAALAFHARGDREMVERLAREPVAGMGMTARITRAVQIRLEVDAENKEAVRRAASLFALPNHAADGARMVWHCADAIWTALGDASDDLNWYTKRASLAGVISSTVLYWLQDESEGHRDTMAFLDRRIADVMWVEKAKAAVKRNPLGKAVLGGVERLGRRGPGRGGPARGSGVYP
jgi:ubiquinone biosynthesis protein COQ9